MLDFTTAKIYHEAKLTTGEIQGMPGFLKDESLEFYNSSAFEKLFQYLCFETGEMPYGIAKARTGDPDVWILEFLDALS